MPITLTCPACKKTLRANDAHQGKRIRCPACRATVPVGAVTPVRPSPAAAPPPERPARPAAPKKGSLLPILAVAGGVLFWLCAGVGTVAGYFVYRAFTTGADRPKPAVVEAPRQAATPAVAPTVPTTEPVRSEPKSEPKPEPNKPDNGDEPKKPVEKPDAPKRPDHSTPMDASKPPVTLRPAEKPKPPAPSVVQPVAASIPMECPPDGPDGIAHILYSAPAADVALAVVRLGFGVNKVRLDRYDLAAGRKLDGVETPVDVLTRNYDFGPDGDLCLFDVGGSNTFTVIRLPDGKPLMSRWTVPPSPTVAGAHVEATVVAAYLLDSKRLLTVNGAAQVFVWSIPDGKPLKEYVPKSYALAVGGLLSGGATAVSRDRNKLAVFNGADGFFVIDSATCKLDRAVTSPEDGKGSPDAVLTIAGVAFSPDGDELAAVFRRQEPGKSAPSATLVRWDLTTGKLADRFPDPTGVGGQSVPHLDWWGSDYFWMHVNNGSEAVLSSWEKPGPLMKPTDKLRERCRPFPGSPDGRLWYVTAGADKQAVFKSVDLPADALRQAGPDPGQLLTLAPDGVVKK